MKKILLSILTIVAIGSFTSVSAQPDEYCGSASTHIPDGTGPNAGGFEPASSTPCVTRGVAYSHDIQFKMFNTFTFQGTHNVDSIQFVKINNLPCGLCWSVDHANKRYSKNVDGLMTISGTTNDVAGQYKFNMTLYAWIDGQHDSVTVSPGLATDAGIQLFIRVQESGGSCPSVDPNATGVTAATGCAFLGIEEVNGAISSMSVVPNPMTSGGMLNFVAAEAAGYTMRVSNITGQVMVAKQIEVKQGENNISIERNGLPTGVYFVSLSNGNATVTKRFSIAE